MTDFSFLIDDVRRQREIAQEALEQARKIDALLREATNASLATNTSVKETLENTKKTLLKVADDSAANAISTSSAATITFLGAGYK
jgi:uncharacterized protein with PhoU and TrkA domain